MCSIGPDETHVCGDVSYPLVMKCWCMRDFALIDFSCDQHTKG